MYDYEFKAKIQHKKTGRPVGTGKYPILFMQEIGDRFFVPDLSRRAAWALVQYWNESRNNRGIKLTHYPGNRYDKKGYWIQRVE